MKTTILLILFTLFFSSCSSRVWVIERWEDGGIVGYQKKGDESEFKKLLKNNIHCEDFKFIKFKNKSEQKSLTLLQEQKEVTQHSGYIGNTGYNGSSTTTKYVPQTTNYQEHWIEAEYKCTGKSKVASEEFNKNLKLFHENKFELAKPFFESDCLTDSNTSYMSCLYSYEIIEGIYGKGNSDSSMYIKKSFDKSPTTCEDTIDCGHIAWIHLKAESYETSRMFFEKALSLSKDPIDIKRINNNIGLTYKGQNNYDKANEYFKKSCSEGERYSCYNLATYFANKNDFRNSEIYFRLSLKNGYDHWKWLENNKDCKNLRKIKNFASIINEAKARSIANEKP